MNEPTTQNKRANGCHCADYCEPLELTLQDALDDDLDQAGDESIENPSAEDVGERLRLFGDGEEAS